MSAALKEGWTGVWHRSRALLMGVGLVWMSICSLAFAGPSWAANPISTENALPGDPHWYRAIASEADLDIYASQSSLLPGEMLQLHVSAATGTRYRVLIYRLGWYQGSGARLIGCVPGCSTDRAGQPYPVPVPEASTGFLDAGWPVTDSFQVPDTAVSGSYIAEAVATTGPSTGAMRFYPFVVRVAPGQAPSHILVQLPVNTEEAYNPWGGKSLYPFNSTGKMPAVKVSFNRPFQDLGPSSQVMDGYEFVRFLERAGYDVSYTTDVDTDSDPGELLQHKLVISDGHDEYWTKAIRDAFDAAREAGTNLAVFGADTGVWQNRYENGDRTIVEYRSASADPETDPALKTVEFQHLAMPRPPCELLGVGYRDGANGYSRQSYTVTQAAGTNTWFSGTGLAPGTVLPSLVGYEWDTVVPGCNVPPLTDLFHWAGSGVSNADSTVYTASSGARVFATGSLDFATGLDEWPGHTTGIENSGLQRFAANLLTDLGGTPPETLEQSFPMAKSSPPVAPVAPAPVPQQITALSIAPTRFRAGPARVSPSRAVARRRAPVGARVTYTDTQAGNAMFTLSKYVRARCRRRIHDGHAHQCLRIVALAHFVRHDSAGANGFRLTGRLRGHRLALGRYLLSAVPQSGLGARGGRSAWFQIVR